VGAGEIARLIVTAFEDRVLEDRKRTRSQFGRRPRCLVKKIGEKATGSKLGGLRSAPGCLLKNSATDYEMKRTRQATADAVSAAKTLLGRPYLWGGNSLKAWTARFHETGFLSQRCRTGRNASHQSQQGTDVPLDAELSQLKKGDLLFFGARARAGRPERISHVGIYLGDKLFIHSSERVRINSLDPNSPISDARRIRTLTHARRVLPD
jgi:cell wall-associated NlpC family hydrolase